MNITAFIQEEVLAIRLQNNQVPAVYKNAQSPDC